MRSQSSETDWKRALAFKEDDEIRFHAEDGPYDPTNGEAALAWFAQADLIRNNGKVVRG